MKPASSSGHLRHGFLASASVAVLALFGLAGFVGLADAGPAPANAVAVLVNPPSGPTAGGTAVTVTGSGFAADVTVTFGGEPATSIVVVNANTLTAIAPAHVAGAVDVVVGNPGSASSTLTGGYRYVVPVTEPNDTLATASELPFGLTAGLTSVNSEVDCYKFYVPPAAAGKDVRVNLRVTSPYPNPLPSGFRSDLDFEVLHGTDRVVAVALSGTDNEILDLHAAASGWYYIYMGYLGFGDTTQVPTYSATITLGPPPGIGWVTGRAVDPGGQPMPGVFVRLQTYPYNHNVTFPIVTTGPDGTFWAAHAGGLHDIQFTGRNVSNVLPDINVEEEYFFDRSEVGDHFTVTEGLAMSLGTMTLQAGAVIEGRVTDPAGAPIQMATVVAGRPGTTLNLSVFTDVDGYYTLMGLPAGGVTLRFSRTGYAMEFYPDQPSMGTATLLPTVAGQISTVDAQLGPSGTISGFVKTPAATAVAATVRLYAAGDSVYSRASTTSSATTGGFSFTGILPGQYVIEFFPSGTSSLPEWWENATSFATATRITVAAGQTVSGLQAVVTDTGSPAPTVTQVVPTSGWVAGGTPVTITGTGFAAGAQVHFGGVAATDVVVVTPTTVTVTSPPRSPGLAEVRVTNSSGLTGRLASAFSYERRLPTLTWATPDPIPFGSPLDSRQLSAAASYALTPLAGAFEYSPPAGTVLPPGAHTVWTRFVPTDAARYAAALTRATVTVVDAGTMTVTPTVLNYAGSLANGALSPITPPQTVMVSYSGVGAPTWTATADQPWVLLSGATGTGSGQFLVSMANPGNVLAGVTSAQATITISEPGASNSPRTVSVNLTLRAPTATQPPLGLVDTPLPGATGVVGTIGVTGWAVDDVGVERVQVFRDCLPFEPAVNCASYGGRSGLVYIGDATLVAGARPDVESIYPTFPQAYRAAWGYLLLTNLLPHVPDGQMFGGQGSLTLSALATDVEGKQSWLGRMLGETSSTTITLANDTIAKPFGAIDTPAQGATVSGAAYANFGWVLTPDTNTTAGEAGDLLMPVNGSTLQLWIDGAPVPGTITYNQCRGTVLGLVAPGQWCDDDVASIFGNPTPLPTLTPRSANPTLFRNLDIGRGAIGALVMDTTALSNGVHTIMWGVTDTAARGEGLGSRYFSVLNTGNRAETGLVRLTPDATNAPPEATSSVVGADLSQPDRAPRRDAPAMRRGEAAALEGLPLAAGEVRGRTGFDLEAPLVPLAPDDAGVWQVTVPDLGRVELLLGPVEAGYLVANGEWRGLPQGSKLDAATGVFTWMPGVGYLGRYDLVFVRGGERIRVTVTIRAGQDS